MNQWREPGTIDNELGTVDWEPWLIDGARVAVTLVIWMEMFMWNISVKICLVSIGNVSIWVDDQTRQPYLINLVLEH